MKTIVDKDKNCILKTIRFNILLIKAVVILTNNKRITVYLLVITKTTIIGYFCYKRINKFIFDNNGFIPVFQNNARYIQ